MCLPGPEARQALRAFDWGLSDPRDFAVPNLLLSSLDRDLLTGGVDNGPVSDNSSPEKSPPVRNKTYYSFTACLISHCTSVMTIAKKQQIVAGRMKIQPTLWRKVSLENQECSQLVINFPAFHGTQRSLSCTQEPATGPCFTQMNPMHNLQTYFRKTHFHITPTHS
jgi:hypothetical protein